VSEAAFGQTIADALSMLADRREKSGDSTKRSTIRFCRRCGDGIFQRFLAREPAGQVKADLPRWFWIQSINLLAFCSPLFCLADDAFGGGESPSTFYWQFRARYCCSRLFAERVSIQPAAKVTNLFAT